MAFFGLLRAIHACTLDDSTTRPSAIRTTYRSTQTRTVNHSSKSRTQLAQQHCCEPHDLSLMILGLENSPYSTSLVRPRLKAAIANPSKCPVYHLQMHRSSSAQLLFTEAATPTHIETGQENGETREEEEQRGRMKVSGVVVLWSLVVHP